MTVYEAITKRDLLRLVEFLSSQPPSDFHFQCFKIRVGGDGIPDLSFFERIKEEGIKIYISEDEDGNIRSDWFTTKLRASSPVFFSKFTKKDVATCVMTFMPPDDFQSGNLKFLKELIQHDFTRAYEEGIEIAELSMVPKYLEYAKVIFGNSMRVVEEKELPEIGKAFTILVDIKKFLGL